MEGILPLAKSTKLDDKQRYGELVSSLGKRVSSDANIVVVMLAANCIEGIARGLRSEFQQYKSLVLSAILERCKEKKQNVVDALKLAMDAVFLSVSETYGPPLFLFWFTQRVDRLYFFPPSLVDLLKALLMIY